MDIHIGMVGAFFLGEIFGSFLSVIIMVINMSNMEE